MTPKPTNTPTESEDVGLREKIVEWLAEFATGMQGDPYYIIHKDDICKEDVDQIMSLIARRDKKIERDGEYNMLLYLKRWMELHNIDCTVGDIDHILSSHKQLPDQPLARETMSRLYPKDTAGGEGK